jgi:AcrR family transcriptional regulator
MALFIINEEGYTNLSMRKLARRLGFTAKTIYNYYSNKTSFTDGAHKGLFDLAEVFRKADRRQQILLRSSVPPCMPTFKWGIENKALL